MYKTRLDYMKQYGAKATIVSETFFENERRGRTPNQVRAELITDEYESAILNSNSMSSAVQLVGCSYNTFKKYAQQYGLWNPNQSGQGIGKSKKYSNIIVDDGFAERISMIFE